MPYSDLVNIASMRLSENGVETELLHKSAHNSICLLEQRARLGDETAIKDLVALGRLVTRILQSLIGQPEDNIEKANKNSNYFPEHSLNSATTTQPTNLRSDVATLLETPVTVLSKFREKYYNKTPITPIKISLKDLINYPIRPDPEAAKLSKKNNISKPQSQTVDNRLKPSAITSIEDLVNSINHSPPEIPLPPTVVPTDALPAALKDDEVAWDDSSFKSAPADFEIIPVFGTSSIINTCRRDYTTYESSPKILVEQIIQCLVSIRIAHVSRRVIRRVAGFSGAWPIQVSAVADKRKDSTENYVSSLKLANKLPIRVLPKPGSGGSRNMKPGSETSFALEVLEWLCIEREVYFSVSQLYELGIPQESEEAKRQVKNCEDILDSRMWLSGKVQIRMDKLPEFSSDEESQTKWLEAAMAFAEAECESDWENYSWPQCINKRIKQCVKKGISPDAEKTVKEALAYGLKNLTKN